MRSYKLQPLARAIRGGLMVSVLGMVMPALAQQASFDIAGGRIEEALPEFARQAGIQIISPAVGDRENAVAVAALKGQMDARQALGQLLAGTGLSVASDDGRTITLRADRPLLAALGSSGLLATQAAAPVAVADTQAPQPARDAPVTLDSVTVVGTQIKGAKSAALLPVATLQAEQIEATGAVSGDELYRSIPQMGDVSFSGTNGGNSSNYARGDIASVNLRGLGVGNTLLLINGRRTVVHPTSQADGNLVPVLTYNANTIPVANLRRVEVLLDGAAAIYGTDAVAGVVNNVLRDDVDGGTISVQRGIGEGTNLRDLGINGLVGRNSEDLRSNITLAFNYYSTTGLNSLDQDWTRSADRAPDFVGTAFEGLSGTDNRNSNSPWGNFTAIGPRVRQGTTFLTTAAGAFHVQPGTNEGCNASLGQGLCVQSGSKATAGADRNLLDNQQAQFPLSITPDVRRVNLFLTGKHDFDNGITAFGEAGWYQSEARSLQSGVNTIAALPMTVAASNYWNPFGATRLPDGSVNPNRLANLNVAAGGIPVSISSYRFERPTQIEVKNTQLRALGGLRGFHFGFDWETAALYSRAKVVDTQDAVSMTLFQQALADSTSAAYNPFCGGCNDYGKLDRFFYKATRKSETELYLWDIKASRPDLFRTWAGDVGMATGLEVRRETQRDDRDARVDGTLTYTDSITGIAYPSDMYGVSPTPDTEGSRTVAGLFAEFSVPLVSREMGIPLVRALDLQVAGRAEHYSDFGNVTKPKLALGWTVVDGLTLRASWAKGFRAPNLEQVNATVVSRSNTRTDYIQCEADVRSGALASINACGTTYRSSTTARRSGNPDLKPETSTNTSAGIVFQPQFIPDDFGRFTFAVDYYKYAQEGIIGLFGEGNGLILDYLLRQQGSSNANVVRAAPTADDIARFAGTGLDPAGKVLYVTDQYVNMQPQTVRGVDYSLAWSSPETGIGRVDIGINGTRLIEFYRDRSPALQALEDAKATGLVDPSIAITGGGDLIGDGGNPKWKWSGNLTWRYQNVTVGASARYASSYHETSLTLADGTPWTVKSQTLANAFVKYDFNSEGMFNGVSLKLGANNLADKRPPVSDDSYGYSSAVYQAYPRYWYASVTKAF
ncbi:TonB-dependent receptor [Stenotrophomonas sp. BIGb0135]|uniref:TonB-dependent receptor n=1 Tax=Stenotrophomonas sp. BIGb0135 TaxID=2940620 RepID=UPI00216A212D|nr:TonB-dependent receptor [Stenotrophomonas sp. BIGb0135]MCS4233730.1 outer membrane receptor protein involved in Fe transport [Stenotrophomonas sp. BIGb0135]